MQNQSPPEENMEIEQFLAQFAFDPFKTGFVGVEREYFLTDAAGMPVPRSPEFLKKIGDPAWTYELSACQVEHRTAPHEGLMSLRKELTMSQYHGELFARSLGLELRAMPVAPAGMPLNVYPHDARYAQLAPGLPEHVLRAACQVAGTHIHIGCHSMEMAIAVYNAVATNMDRFIAMGDTAGDGRRMALYESMAGQCRPQPYRDARHFFEVAQTRGFADNPRNCWDLVRISRHGTVELRMFDATMDVMRVIHWIDDAHNVIAGRPTDWHP